IVAINTMKAMAITPELKMPSLANRFGGLSGPAIRPIGVRAVYDICEKVHIPVIGVGGVGSGRDALEYIMAGASAVQVGTAILSRGLGVFDEITKEMASLLEEAASNRSLRRSGSPMPRMQVVPLLEIVRETPTTMTYRFRGDLGGTPGQFLMVWIPR